VADIAGLCGHHYQTNKTHFVRKGGRALRPATAHESASDLDPGYRTERGLPVKVRIDSRCCQGHGRCYDLAPGLFGDDDEGYGRVLGEGTVSPGQERDARLAAANCPEHAIELVEER
jgi:ferredoxin